MWPRFSKPFAYDNPKPNETLNAISQSERYDDPKWGDNEDEDTEVILFQGEPVFASYEQDNKGVFLSGIVGLDILSTTDLFYDTRMIINIRTFPRAMTIMCTAGQRNVRQIGHTAGYGED